MREEIFLLDKPGKVELVTPFEKEGEEVVIMGVVRAEMAGEYEVNVVSDHKVGNSYGKVKIRGIAKNGARVKVTGTIKIDEGAQGVDDFLEMKLLVLDEKSSAVAEPRLEIEANEVKASHAATVGMIDEEELFYLMVRGICRESAEKMIVEGFLGEVGGTI